MEYRRLSLAYGSELEEVTSLSLVLVEAMVFSGILTAQLWGGGAGGEKVEFYLPSWCHGVNPPRVVYNL